MEEFTEEELAILEEYQVRETQLRSIRRIMAAPLPKKKAKHFKDKVLPEHLIRELNARTKADRIMKKHGYSRA